MRRLPYFLLFLLTSALVDDAWAIALALPSPSLAEENDEYLPAQRPCAAVQLSSHQRPVLVSLKLQTVDCSIALSTVPTDWNLAFPSAHRSLYVLMSLQI
jgi:hypothetical protein